MGSSRDIMQTYAEKEVRAHFKKCDGWECAGPIALRTRMTCILSREVRGRKETVVLAVSYDEEASTLSLEAVAASLNRKSLNGQYRSSRRRQMFRPSQNRFRSSSWSHSGMWTTAWSGFPGRRTQSATCSPKRPAQQKLPRRPASPTQHDGTGIPVQGRIRPPSFIANKSFLSCYRQGQRSLDSHPDYEPDATA